MKKDRSNLLVGGEGLELTPTVRRLLGVARGDLGREDYRHHLLEKYGQ